MKYHLHISIAKLLAMSDAELTKKLSPGNAEQLRATLVSMQAAGKTVVTGADCDRQDAEGMCQGHPEPRDLGAA